eukprot:CAMPEP_0117568160 /NCGR_PEP_ID=MMETSP0784-20121206/57990_1 /TAXON_ID=39447 /ORGANISM="" /LENGTH=44 /DNA_ID= /DNA_START= /DNA_END= /DNA_ORIENTATION=
MTMSSNQSPSVVRKPRAQFNHRAVPKQAWRAVSPGGEAICDARH